MCRSAPRKRRRERHSSSTGMGKSRGLHQTVAGVLCLRLVPIFLAASNYEWKRLSQKATFSPQGQGWESAGKFNPAVVDSDGRYVMLHRAQGAQGVSRLGYAESSHGIRFTRRADPVLSRRPGKFDSRVVEPGPPPNLTREGIVLIYNGADDKLVYRTGIAVFDRRDPRKLIYRGESAVFEPELAGGTRPGAECGICRRHGEARQKIAFLPWWRRQIRRGRRSTDADCSSIAWWAVIFSTGRR
jgi:hypothetical protein